MAQNRSYLTLARTVEILKYCIYTLFYVGTNCARSNYFKQHSPDLSAISVHSSYPLSNEVAMQWIEIIHLRAFNKKSKNNALTQVQELSDRCKLKNLTEIVLWIRSNLDSDISLFLCWRKPTRYRAYSQVGLQLVFSSKEID